MKSAPTTIHPFERAGLGKAPFRVIGYAVRTYQACPGAPIQVGGSCQYCGQGIKHTYTILGADGRSFEVGETCAERAGTALGEAARMARRREERRAEDAEYRRQRAIRDEQERDDNEAAGLGRITHREHMAALAEKRAEERDQARLAREAQRAASVHVGTLGERLDITVTLVHNTSWDTQFGGTNLFVMVDDSGNTLTWKTSSWPRCAGADGYSVAASRGDRITMRATVKSHGHYQGNAQTLLTRCKVSEIEKVEQEEAGEAA